MYGLFKKYLIPHSENDHQPHILRIEAVLIMLAAVFAVEVLFIAHVFVLSRSGMLASIITNVLVDRTNDVRLADGLPALVIDPLLARAATMKAEDMAKGEYFAHTSPTGITPWHWFSEVGYQYSRAGENLAVNFVDSEDVVRAWLHSPKHRENMENGHYTEIGIGTARGVYRGEETTFIVQLFGLPAVAAEPEIVGSADIVPAFKPVAVLNENDEPVLLPQTADVAGAETPADNTVVVSGVAEIEAQLPLPKVGETKRYAKLLERLASSPRAVAQAFYLTLATLVALALTFVFFLRAPVPHPHLVKHGVTFLVIVGAVVLLNHYAALASAQIF